MTEEKHIHITYGITIVIRKKMYIIYRSHPDQMESAIEICTCTTAVGFFFLFFRQSNINIYASYEYIH